jgi:hypothetical protein
MSRALWAAALFSSLALVGCKSDIEKYSDDVCACSDKKCLDDVQAKWKDKIPKDEGGKKLADMPPKEKEAMEKAIACALKASGVGK